MDNEQDNDILDNEDALDDLEESAGAPEGAEDAPPATDNDGSDTESKRINDLMSKWQAAQAENAKLKAQLEGRGGQTRGKRRAAAPAREAEFMEFAREHARNTLFSSDPRLAKYGISAEDISGETPEEMRTSFQKQLKLIDSLESRIRNDVLAQHGLDPSVAAGGGAEAAPDFGAMSPEEFAKFVERRDGLL